MAWFEARESGASLEPAIDRQLACALAIEALSQRVRTFELRTLSWRDLCELRGLFEPGNWELPTELASRVEADPTDLALLHAILDLGAADGMVGAIRRLLEVDRRAEALRVFERMEQPFAKFDAAEILAEGSGAAERAALAEKVWRAADKSTYLDQFGPAFTTSIWLESLVVWAPGDPDGRARAHWLDSHLGFFDERQLEGTQDFRDLRALMAEGWAHHGNTERALAWYRRIGPERHWSCAAVAPRLPADIAEVLYREAFADAVDRLVTDFEAGRGPNHYAFDFLEPAPKTLCDALADEIEGVFVERPIERQTLALALCRFLSPHRARQTWRGALDFFASVADEPSEPVDDLLEELLNTMPDSGADALLPWVERWPRSEPLEAIPHCWPKADLARPFNALWARDPTPGTPWRTLLEDIAEVAPELQRVLPSEWATPKTGPRPRRLWFSDETLVGMLSNVAAEDQVVAIDLYTEILGLPHREKLLESLRETRTPATWPEPTDAKHELVRGALRRGDNDAVRSIFAAFDPPNSYTTTDTVWFTRLLIGHADIALAEAWIEHLQRHTTSQILSWLRCVVGGDLLSPERREWLAGQVDDFARRALCRRDFGRQFHDWTWTLPLVSRETAIRLWERRMVGQVRPLRYAEIKLALVLGGVERLRPVFTAFADERFLGLI